MGTHHLAIITIAYVLLLYPKLSLEVVDFISQSQPIRDVDNVTLVSKSGAFELGFFTPANSNKRYLGIWYKNIPIQTIVWVANRDSPINDSTGILTLNSTGGNLVLAQNHTVVWSTTSVKTPKNPVVNLLDSGNLVIREDKEENPENYLWQSFDYPTDTSLPGMKFGWDLRTGLNRRRVAWKSPNDPSTGDFSLEMVLNNYPEAYIMKGTQKFYRAGPWNGLRPSGTPQIKDNPIYDYKSVSNKNEIYYMYELKNKSVISRQVLNITTQALQRFIWLEAEQVWRLFQAVPTDYCDSYGLCGGNGICTISGSPICQCLKGFSPKSPQKWNSIDWSNGCVRNKNLSCMDDGFVRMSNVKLPDTAHSWLDETMTLEECRNKCFNNCSCMAYTNSDIRGQGSGCAMWFGNLIDIINFSDGGQDLYVRMAASELANPGGAKGNNSKRKGIVIAATISTISVMLFTFLCIYKKSRKSRVKTDRTLSIENIEEDTLQEDMELPFYNFDIIARATNNFSIDNKLGQGGFGSVYKGVLVDGQEIAVKRLSQNSQQGTKEFKNEVILCAKLQHRNLVKVLGCCIQREEKMLIYEYMQNKSLDSFIFGPSQSKLLDWSKCFHIICGIARGLMYLHQDSTLRIIHRDLKASNILLDNELNPKISDFGLARIFGSDQIEENTRRVVGTYGYMAPEYASHGLFSIKSDVFSFGILILEIVSGKKNRGFSFASQSQNLIGHVWRLWKENIPLKLIDAHLEESCIKSEVLRCIHVGLLCLQHHPNDRPNMASVVVMLTSEVDLAQPKEPGFLLENMTINSESSSSNHMPASNRISTTEIEPR